MTERTNDQLITALRALGLPEGADVVEWVGELVKERDAANRRANAAETLNSNQRVMVAQAEAWNEVWSTLVNIGMNTMSEFGNGKSGVEHALNYVRGLAATICNLRQSLHAAEARAREAEGRLDYLKSCGLTVGTMKEADKPPRLMYVIELGSKLCDQRTLDKLLESDLALTAAQARIAELESSITKGPHNRRPIMPDLNELAKTAHFGIAMANSALCPMAKRFAETSDDRDRHNYKQATEALDKASAAIESLLAQAREAERLREALEKLADRASQRRCTCSVIARAALQPQQETPDA
jgi:hypothetical protein